jgi:hypothetical protein
VDPGGAFYNRKYLRFRTYCSQKTGDKRVIATYVLRNWRKDTGLGPDNYEHKAAPADAIEVKLSNFSKRMGPMKKKDTTLPLSSPLAYSKPSPMRKEFLKKFAEIYRRTTAAGGARRPKRAAAKPKPKPKRAAAATTKPKPAKRAAAKPKRAAPATR